MGNSCRIFIAIILIISLFTVSVFATPTGSYDLYSTNGRNVNSYSASGNSYISNFSQHLAYIRVYLDQILSYNANISSTIDYYLPNILTRIVDAFSPAAGDSRSMWQLSSAMVSGITAIQSAALGIAQDVYNISTYVDGIESKLDSINSHEYNIEQYNNAIQSKLTTLNQTEISSLAKLTNIDTNVDQVESQLSNINNNLNKLSSKYNWRTVDFVNFLGTSLDNENYQIGNLRGNPVYAKINFTTLTFGQPILCYVRLPIGLTVSNNFVNLELFPDNPNISTKLIYVDYGLVYTDIYFIFDTSYYNVSNFIFKYNFKNSELVAKYDFTYFIKYLYPTDYGYYDFLDHLALMNLGSNNSDLTDIKNILIDIDNNSDFIQNNNDLQINVDIDPSVGQGITVVISKIQDLLDFGISLQEFLVVLNQFDNLNWFTRLKTYEQVNYDPSDNIGYQNLYD